jgi:hypothetical protein
MVPSQDAHIFLLTWREHTDRLTTGCLFWDSTYNSGSHFIVPKRYGRIVITTTYGY